MRKILGSKIHRATVTHANVDYEGSITIPADLLERTGIYPLESVYVWNVTNGNRFETYAIEGEPFSGTFSVNGAAAHLVEVGDIIIIAQFLYMTDETYAGFTPKLVFMDENNQYKEERSEVPGPQLKN